MSITVIFAAIGIPLLIAGIGFAIMVTVLDSDWRKVFLAVSVAMIGAGLVIAAGGNYSQNRQDSQQACVDNGGYLLVNGESKFCLTEPPEILRPV